jgi:hypothetical protein
MNLLRRRRSFSIRARLVLLILATVLPLVALAGFAASRSANHERSRIERDVRERVENLLTDVTREIASVELSLKILASSPSLQKGDLEAFGNQIREALKVQGLAIGLHDIAANELVGTAWPYSEQLARESNRGMVDIIVRSGRPHVSNLFIGTMLQRPILTVGVPILRGEKVLYVLTMALDPAFFSQLLQDQNLPPNWTAEIFDRRESLLDATRISAASSAIRGYWRSETRRRRLSRIGYPASPVTGRLPTPASCGQRSPAGRWRLRSPEMSSKELGIAPTRWRWAGAWQFSR